MCHSSLQDVTACPEYPVHNYTLVVVDSEGNRATQTSQTTGDIVNISISGLIENPCYSYYVIATNQFGNSRPSIACRCKEICNLVIIETGLPCIVAIFATTVPSMEACPGATFSKILLSLV